VIHCAAATKVDWCKDHPELAVRINVHASSFLAEVADGLDPGFLYISTDSVFDGERGNYSETIHQIPSQRV
jgi:dTDP-4-dehydrorhamnose reductase